MKSQQIYCKSILSYNKWYVIHKNECLDCIVQWPTNPQLPQKKSVEKPWLRRSSATASMAFLHASMGGFDRVPKSSHWKPMVFWKPHGSLAALTSINGIRVSFINPKKNIHVLLSCLIISIQFLINQVILSLEHQPRICKMLEYVSL